MVPNVQESPDLPPPDVAPPAPAAAAPPRSRPSSGGDPAIDSLIEQFPENMRPGLRAEYDLLRNRTGDQSAVATAARDAALATGERQAREAVARQHRDELERYRSRRVDLPDFIPTQENALSLGTLFGLIGVAGTLMGGRGQQSAMGALNAMSGMMAGWRQGRADLYNRERQKYDQEMRRVQEQNNILQRDFQDALNLMKTDLDAGLARAREAAAKHGVSIAGAAATRQGAAGVQSWLQSLRSSLLQINQNNSRLSGTYQRVQDPNNPEGALFFNTRTNDYLRDPATGAPIPAAPLGRPSAPKEAKPIVVAQRQEDGSTRYVYARPSGEPLMQNGEPVIAPTPRGAGDQTPKPSATETRQRRDIRGQLRYLSEFMPEEEVENLGTREVPAVTTRMESAELSSRLAEEVRRNPQAAGLAARLIRRLEVLDPTRYGGNEQSSTFGSIVAAVFGQSIDNASIEGSAEAVTKARQIAKLAVDVINARALAASGGSRMLVMELNFQKGVIGLEGLTPESAPVVYQRLADDDVAAMRRFGISYERLSEIKNKLNEKAREYVRSGGRMPPEREARAASGQSQPPSSAFEGMQNGQERTFGNGQVWRMEGGTPVRIR